MDFPAVVKRMGLRGELSVSVARAILVQSDSSLALVPAFGEWMADPKGEIRPELGELWRQAVLRNAELEPPNRVASYQLTHLLGADPELAYEWLLRLAAETTRPDSEIRSAARSALGFLGAERRQDLLERLSAGSVLMEYLPQLIDHDVELYRGLLRRKALEEFHLLPLQGLPGPDWADLARLALCEGFGPEKVAHAAYSGHHFRSSGTGEEYWRRWDEAFASLESPADMDSAWQEVIRHGREYARRRICEAQERGRRFELDGMLPDPG